MLELATLRSHSQQGLWSCEALVKIRKIVLILTKEVICVRKFKPVRFVPGAGSSPGPKDAVEGLDAGWSTVSWKMKHLPRGGTPGGIRGVSFMDQSWSQRLGPSHLL